MRLQSNYAARALTLSALALAMSVAWAEDKGHPAAGKAEAAYEGAPSGIKPGDAVDMMDTEGPPMTQGRVRAGQGRSSSSAAPVATGCCARAPPASP